jgi:uncharacterized membrane protein
LEVSRLEEPAESDDFFVDVEGQTVAELHRRAEEGVSGHQRLLERVAAGLGRPVSVYLVVTGVLAWVLANGSVGQRLGFRAFDPPPFDLLQCLMTGSALVTSIVVLVSQNRQGAMSRRRSLLSLHVTLLVEHKVAKLISLVEELRRDMPAVHDRNDPEAAAMTRTVDPQAVMDKLEQATAEAAAVARKPVVSEQG